MGGSSVPLRRSLFQKYFTVLFIAVVVPLLVTSIADAWFGYRDQRAMLDTLLRAEAASGADRIGASSMASGRSWAGRFSAPGPQAARNRPGWMPCACCARVQTLRSRC